MTLSNRFDQALQYAAWVHAGQTRKDTGVPYLAHLLGVAGITMEYGGDEEQAIAALLHDAAEDYGGKGRLADIAARFGGGVAEIVAGCSDTLVSPKPPWRERKENYVMHLHKAPARVRLVSAADKLHNTRSLLQFYRVEGENVWGRFAGGRAGTLWYYRMLVEAFRRGGTTELVEELDRVVSQIELMAGTAYANIV
jgi:(p)ppGpp synthase/HD superfamily hydrolase